MQRIILLMAVVVFASCTGMQEEKVELVIDSRSDLGEGAIWDGSKGELIWINITGKILNFYNPKTGFNKEMFTGQMIGTVVPTESGTVIVALKDGIYRMDPETGAKSLITDPEEHLPDNRFNDGKCDPSGRFWAGTMSLVNKKGTGSLYRLDPDSTIHKMIEGVTISNGIVWSHDRDKMYYIDTPTRKVMGYSYNDATGEITDPFTAVEIPQGMGAPDGMTIDSEGNLWIALWGGAAVGCWNPETGDLLRTIDVPARNVTSCAFGDDDLGTLYITTARRGTKDEDLEQFPNAGGVFKIRPGIKGVKAYYFNDK